MNDTLAAEHALDAAENRRAEAVGEKERVASTERRRLEEGAVTAGALTEAHRWQRTSEQRIHQLDDDARKAAERAGQARAGEERARLDLERAHAAETAVNRHAERLATEARVHREEREAEALGDAWNANAAHRRSPGRR
jgi:hypothetical protein